jgi:hypothetical protein
LKKTNEKNLDGLYYTYGYYFGQIWVSPTNPDKVIIAGVPILVSENGGKSFKSIDSPNVHADHHSIWFNPKMTIISSMEMTAESIFLTTMEILTFIAIHCPFHSFIRWIMI